MAYQLLERMCKVKGIPSQKNKKNAFTPRVKFIMNVLKQSGIRYEYDLFDSFLNIYVWFDGKDASSTVVYLAHHDIVNPHSENCNDNTASVCNLLALASHFKDNKPSKNVVIAFTDAEEIGGYGSRELADKIYHGKFGNVEYAINVELTAYGTHIWMDDKYLDAKSKLSNVARQIEPNIVSVATPFNDSVVLREHGVDSVCFGTLNASDYLKAKSNQIPNVWKVYHSKDDTFDQAVSSDMDNFVKFLSKFAKSPSLKEKIMLRIKRAFFVLSMKLYS